MYRKYNLQICRRTIVNVDSQSEMVISVISLKSLRNYGGTVFNMNIQNSGDIMKGIVQCTCLIDNV